MFVSVCCFAFTKLNAIEGEFLFLSLKTSAYLWHTWPAKWSLFTSDFVGYNSFF